MLKSLIEADINYEQKKKELSGILGRIERSGINVGPLKQAIWNYAEAFAGWEMMKRLNNLEREAVARYKIEDKDK